MDAFFASVEQRDNPALQGMPIAVGHEGQRGVVAAASYEARRYGVRSAMPSVKARALCPELIFVHGNFDKYKSVSAQMHDIFHEYTDIIEPISLDEAYLDVTQNKPGIELAVEIARQIKQKIRQRLKLIASAGVSYNKFLSKLASDYRKPDGLCTVHPSRAIEFIDNTPVENFWGIGPVTARRMHEMGILNGADLRQCSLDELRYHFGKAGQIYYNFARGEDPRPVYVERYRKSIGCETTLEHDIASSEEVNSTLHSLTEELCRRLDRKDFDGHTLTLKVKHNDFTTNTRSITLPPSSQPLRQEDKIYYIAHTLIDKIEYTSHPLRLLGLSVSRGSAESEDDDIYREYDGLWRQLHIIFPDSE